MDKSSRWVNFMDIVVKKPIEKIKEYREVIPPTMTPKARQIWVEERLKDLVAAINQQLSEKGCDQYVKKWIDELAKVKNMI